MRLEVSKTHFFSIFFKNSFFNNLPLWRYRRKLIDISRTRRSTNKNTGLYPLGPVNLTNKKNPNWELSLRIVFLHRFDHTLLFTIKPSHSRTMRTAKLLHFFFYCGLKKYGPLTWKYEFFLMVYSEEVGI